MLEGLDPFEALAAWMADAERSEPDVPDAMQLATVDPAGRPSVRTVLLKSHGPDGLVFYTNYGSRKARELDATGRAAVVLHWKSLARQVVAEGGVTRVDAATSDAYFATRPRGSQIGAWASDQSAVLDDPATLEARVAAVAARFEGRPVPRPPSWGGYRLVPERIEFWQGKPSRLHDRIVFRRGPEGWIRERLYP